MNLSSIVDPWLDINKFGFVWHCSAKKYDKTIDNEFTVADKTTHQCVGPKSEERSIFFKILWITVINRSGKPAEIDAYIRNNPLLYSTDPCNIQLNECKPGKIPAKVNPSNRQSYSLEHSHEITLALYNNHTFNSECNDIRFTLEINEQVAYFFDFNFNKIDSFKNDPTQRVKKVGQKNIYNSYLLKHAVKKIPIDQEILVDKVPTVIPQQPLADTPITNVVETTVTTVVTTVKTVFKSNISNERNLIWVEENTTQNSSPKEKPSTAFHPYRRPLNAKPRTCNLEDILN